MGDWCDVESDPGVFTELLAAIGVQGLQVEEIVYDVFDVLEDLKPVFGLIFLFKYESSKKMKEKGGERMFIDPPLGLWFANQVIPNACSTQALLHILLNMDSQNQQFELGSTLTQLKEVSMEFDPGMKGLALGNFDTIREAHNSFAKSEPFVFEGTKSNEKDDVFHYVAIIPWEGKIIEIDGLRDSICVLGEIVGDKKQSPCVSPHSWVNSAMPLLQSRMKEWGEGEIRFNILAVVRDRLTVLKEKLTANSSEEEEMRIRQQISQEEERRRKWKVENMRRHFNYIPFIMRMLIEMGREGLITRALRAGSSGEENEEDSKKKEKE